MSDEQRSTSESSASGSSGEDSSEGTRTPDRRAFLRYGAAAGVATILGVKTGCGSEAVADPEPPEQADSTPEGEVVRLYDDNGRLVEVSEDAVCHLGDAPTDREEVRRGVEGMSFVMVIDLASCRNARRCVEECQSAHGLRPDQEYVRVTKMGDTDDPRSHNYWKPELCFQCDNPPCTKVCPVDATFKRDDGIVGIDANQCIGCRFCMAACPYNARVFNWNEPLSKGEEHDHSPETSLPKQKGVVDKCDFCPDMVRRDELPHCVSACPNNVFYFGDRNEDVVTNGNETVRLSELLQERGGYRYLEELGTKPRVYYLPARNKQFPFERGMENYEEARDKIKDYRLERRPSDHGDYSDKDGE